MKFLSYAQNFEDLMLWRALGHIESGFYVDVGANDPTVDSATKAFYDRGWSGINIEPHPKHFQDLVAHRPNDINLCIAAGNTAGELELWDFGIRGWSTANLDVVEKHKLNGHIVERQVVPVTPLSTILQTHASGEIHFLKIDVEGLEKHVLEGADFVAFRPWIVVVESTVPNSREESFLDWEFLLLDRAYHFCYFDGLNRFYVASEHQDISGAFALPPNVFDEFELYSEYLKEQELLTLKSELANAQQSLIERQRSNCELEASLSEVQGRLNLILSSATWRWRARILKLLSRVTAPFK